MTMALHAIYMSVAIIRHRSDIGQPGSDIARDQERLMERGWLTTGEVLPFFAPNPTSRQRAEFGQGSIFSLPDRCLQHPSTWSRKHSREEHEETVDSFRNGSHILKVL